MVRSIVPFKRSTWVSVRDNHIISLCGSVGEEVSSSKHGGVTDEGAQSSAAEVEYSRCVVKFVVLKIRITRS